MEATTMSKCWAYAIGGALAGVFVGVTWLRQSETRCCAALRNAVREATREKLGDFGVALGDALSLWDVSPELLALGAPGESK
jgi:hypothetical protein